MKLENAIKAMREGSAIYDGLSTIYRIGEDKQIHAYDLIDFEGFGQEDYENDGWEVMK